MWNPTDWDKEEVAQIVRLDFDWKKLFLAETCQFWSSLEREMEAPKGEYQLVLVAFGVSPELSSM